MLLVQLIKKRHLSFPSVQRKNIQTEMQNKTGMPNFFLAEYLRIFLIHVEEGLKL